MAAMIERTRKRLSKRAKKGFRGWPVATVALYGPDDSTATKLTVGIMPAEDAEATDLRRFRRSRPLAASAQAARHRGRAHPPCGRRTRRRPWGCTTCGFVRITAGRLHASKPLHGPFSSSKRPMRILRAIVEPTTDLVAVGIADLFHRRGIRAKAVGDDLPRSAVPLHDPLEKLQRRSLVPLRSDDRFQNIAFMIDGAPEIAELAVDLHKDLVQVPTPLRIPAHVRHPLLSDLGSKHRAKPVPPKPDRLMADVDPALGQEVFDVAQRQRVFHVHHHDQTDHFWRAVEISERVVHGPKLPQPKTARKIALTTPPRRCSFSALPSLSGARPGAIAIRQRSRPAYSQPAG